MQQGSNRDCTIASSRMGSKGGSRRRRTVAGVGVAGAGNAVLTQLATLQGTRNRNCIWERKEGSTQGVEAAALLVDLAKGVAMVIDPVTMRGLRRGAGGVLVTLQSIIGMHLQLTLMQRTHRGVGVLLLAVTEQRTKWSHGDGVQLGCAGAGLVEAVDVLGIAVEVAVRAKVAVRKSGGPWSRAQGRV
jgi:hypothetical protein